MDNSSDANFIRLCELLKVDAQWFPEFDEFTTTPDFLLEVVNAISNLAEESRTIIECGSGISTLVIARYLQVLGDGYINSLEHDPNFSARTYNWLEERKLADHATVHLKPLIGSPPWYALGGAEVEAFDLLVIDGPPKYIHQAARYGAKSLFPLLKEGGIVLVDDAVRDDEIINKWAMEFPALNWTRKDAEKGLAIGALGRAKKSVLIAIPNMGDIRPELVCSLISFQKDLRYNSRLIQPSFSPSDNNRHHIFKNFLEGKEDYLLMIDSDNPPMRNVLDLIDLDKDIIGCPTLIWRGSARKKGEMPVYENAFKYVPESDLYREWEDKFGIQQVDAIGTGCILIARRVLEHPEMQKGANQRTLKEDGTTRKGGDIMFCERARKNGFKIFAHFGYKCRHYKTLELRGVARAFNQLLE